MIFRSEAYGYTRFELSFCHRLLLLAEKGRGIGVLELLDVQTIPLNCDKFHYISLLSRHVCQTYYKGICKVVNVSNGNTCVGGCVINLFTPNVNYNGRTAPLTSKVAFLYIYLTKIGIEYFKHGIYSPFFPFKMQFVS